MWDVEGVEGNMGEETFQVVLIFDRFTVGTIKKTSTVKIF